MSATIRIPAKRSKYGVRQDAAGKLARTYGDVLYDSAAEARYAAQLDLRLKAGEITGWGRQHRCPLIVNGVRICTMVVDFTIYMRGAVEYVDVKGVITRDWALKRKLFEALTGDKITIVHAKDVR